MGLDYERTYKLGQHFSQKTSQTLEQVLDRHPKILVHKRWLKNFNGGGFILFVCLFVLMLVQLIYNVALVSGILLGWYKQACGLGPWIVNHYK